MKADFPKCEPKQIIYRNYKNFNDEIFRHDLKTALACKRNNNYDQYEHFEKHFLQILNKHAPMKTKTVRANDVPYLTKKMRKAIMKRSYLEKRFHQNRTVESRVAYKKQRNYCSRLAFYTNLDLRKVHDVKDIGVSTTFWLKK